MNRTIKQITLCGMAVMFAISSCKTEGKTEEEITNVVPQKITKVVGIARIEPENGLLYVYANSTGTIVNMTHKENDIVEKDAVLITLDQKADLAQLAMEKSKITSHSASVIAAEETLKTVNADLQKAKEDVALNEQLFAAKAITKQALNDSKVKAKKLIAEYNKQIAEVKKVKSQRTEIDATIKYKSILLSQKNITAPLKGKILQWDVHLGDYINSGQKLGQFAPEGPLVAVTEVDELFADKVQLGMKADILSQLDGQKIAEGDVVFVADFLKKKSLFSDENEVEDRRVRTVKIRLTPESKAIINARVDCIIKLKL